MRKKWIIYLPTVLLLITLQNLFSFATDEDPEYLDNSVSPASKQQLSPLDKAHIASDIATPGSIKEKSPTDRLEHKSEEAIECIGDVVEYFSGGEIVEGRGNVVVTYADAKLTCDVVRVNVVTKFADAEGNVKLYRQGGIWESDVLHYNFATKQGESPDVKMTMGPWLGITDKVSKIEEDLYRLKEAYLTTCDKDFAHYRIKGRKVYVYPGEKIVIHDAVFYFGGSPIFYLPYYSYSLKERPHVIITGGKNREWGHFVLTATRYKIKEYVAGRILFDYRELMSHAWGVIGDYNTHELNIGQGEFWTYYLPERNKQGLEYTEDERYRARLEHHWEIDEQNRFFGKYQKLSDATIVKDYFWREYEEDFVTGAYSEFSHWEDQYTISCIVDKRINRFFGATEKLPEVNWNIPGQKIGESNFYYQSSQIVTVFNIASANIDEDEYANRLYSSNQLSYPTRLPGNLGLGWINFNPYIGTKQIYYSRTLEAIERNKIIGQHYAGWSAQTRFYRTFGLTSRFLGIEINDLRHVITPTVGFGYVGRPTTPPGNVANFSGDNQSHSKAFTFTLENRLQTKRYYDKKDRVAEKVDLLFFKNSIDYNVHFDSETRGSLSNISSELDIFPYSYLSLYSDAVVDPYEHIFTSGSVGAQYNQDKWKAAGESRWIKEANGQITYEVEYTHTPFWRFRTYALYDRKWRSFLENEYTIWGDLHCWIFEFSINKQKKKGNTVWIILTLKAFPGESPIKFRKGYHQYRRNQVYGMAGQN
ncbi:MAG: hypothetical protein ABH952_09365 [Candidatus Omnitrophota bacterium]